jgi:hypothetical protein
MTSVPSPLGLDRPELPTPPVRDPHRPLGLNEVEALAMGLQSAGFDVGERVARIFEIHAAIDGAWGQNTGATSGLLDLDPAEVSSRVRQAAAETAGQLNPAAAGVDQAFISALVVEGIQALKDISADVIADLQPRFAAALKVVQTAADVGLTSATTADEVVASADAKQMTASPAPGGC